MNAWKKNSPGPGRGYAESGNSSGLESLRPSLPCLFPWQILFFAYVLGIAGNRFLVPAGVGLLLLWHVVKPSLDKAGILPLTLAFGLGLGWGWINMPSPAPSPPEWMMAREKVRISGVVETLRPRPENKLQIIVGSVQYTTNTGEEGTLPGSIVWTWEFPEFWPEQGQRVTGVFRIKPVRFFKNPGSWDLGWYWARRGVYYRTYTRAGKTQAEFTPTKAFSLRKRLRASFQPFPDTQGRAMVKGLVLGERFDLTYQTMDLMQRAGLSHSLALSGMHLGFVISLGWVLAYVAGWIRPRLYELLPRSKLAVLLAVPLAAGYLWLGGYSPSLLRAALMFFFWGVLLFLGRERVLMDGLIFALVAILVVSPLSVFEISLQLSALAVAGIILFMSLFSKVFTRLRQRGKWGTLALFPLSILAASVAANLALLPLSMHTFGHLSPHLYLNVLWLPLLGWFVLPAGLIGLVFSVLPGLSGAGTHLLHFAVTVSDFMLGSLQWMDSHGRLAPNVTMRPSWLMMAGYWLFLFWLLVRGWRRPSWRWSLPVMALILVAGTPFVSWLFRQGEYVEMTVLDVGQGQSVLLETGGGKRYLIDGGGSWSSSFDIGKAVVVPMLTYRRLPRLDKVLLSHPDKDHLRGLFYPLQTFKVGGFYSNGDRPEGDGSVLDEILSARNIPAEAVHAGDEIRLDRDMVLEVLHPDRDYASSNFNNRSLVVRLVWQGKGIALVPGDIMRSAMRKLCRQKRDLSAHVLVVPHHGSKSSLYTGFYEKTKPRLAVASAGFLNQFRHPSQKVQKALSGRNIPLYSTSEYGAVTVRWEDPNSLPQVSGVIHSWEEASQ